MKNKRRYRPSIRKVKYRGTKVKKEKVYEKQLLSSRYRDIEQYIADRKHGGVFTEIEGGKDKVSKRMCN